MKVYRLLLSLKLLRKKTSRNIGSKFNNGERRHLGSLSQVTCLVHGSDRKQPRPISELNSDVKNSACPEPPPLLTFTLGYGSAPHHLPFVQLAGDGLGALGLDEAVLTHHRHRAAQLEAVSEAPGVDGDARVGALVVAEGCGRRNVEEAEGGGRGGRGG